MSRLENLVKSVVADLLLEVQVRICFQQSSVGGYWVKAWLKDCQHYDDCGCNCADKAIDDGHFVHVAT